MRSFIATVKPDKFERLLPVQIQIQSHGAENHSNRVFKRSKNGLTTAVVSA